MSNEPNSDDRGVARRGRCLHRGGIVGVGLPRVSLRYSPSRILIPVVLVLGAFLLSRSLSSLAEELALLTDPVLLAFGVSLVLIAVLGCFVPSVVRYGQRLVALLLVAGVLGNLTTFADADPSSGLALFAPRPDNRLVTLDRMPGADNYWKIYRHYTQRYDTLVGRYNHWYHYRVYTWIHEHARGSAIIDYRPATPVHPSFDGLLHPFALKYVAEVLDYSLQSYDHALSASQLEWIRTHKCLDTVDVVTGLRWVVPETVGPRRDTYRVLSGEGVFTLVRESLLPELGSH